MIPSEKPTGTYGWHLRERERPPIVWNIKGGQVCCLAAEPLNVDASLGGMLEVACHSLHAALHISHTAFFYPDIFTFDTAAAWVRHLTLCRDDGIRKAS